MKKNKMPRTRNFSLVVYNLDDLNLIINQPNKVQKYAYIYHDKDFTIDKETNEKIPKVPHYHLYVRFYSPYQITWLDTLQKKETFKENILIELCADPERLILYFVHKLNPEKYQYPETDIISSFDISKITNENETTDHADIYKEIEKITCGQSTWSQLFRKYPKLIYSANSLKTVYELLYSENYMQEINVTEYRKAFIKECDKTLKKSYNKPVLVSLPKNTKSPFD